MVSTKPIEYTNPLGSYQSTFEIGAPNGIVLTVDVTAAPFISFTDKSGSYSVLRGADPVIDDDLATKRYADSLITTPQYWDRNAVPPIPILFPLTAGDAVKIDAPGYLEVSLIQNSLGSISIDMPWAVGSRTLSVGNSLNAFTTYLTVDGSVSTDSVIPLNSPGVLNLLYDSVTATGDGVSLVSAMIPGSLIFIPTGAVTDFTFVAPSEFVGNVEFLSGLVNLFPFDYTTIAVPVDGDIVIDTSLVTNERLGFYDGILAAWQWAVTGPAGSNTEIQFNDGGVLGTDSLFTFIKATNRLGLGIAVPTQAIQIETGVNTGSIKLTNTANASGLFLTLDSTGVGYIHQAGAFDFAILSGINRPFTIASSGKIGLGVGATALTPTRGVHIDSTDGMHLHPCALPAGAAGDICIDSGAANALKFHNGVGWITPGVTIGGSDTHIQYNDTGALAGTAALVWKHTTSKLGINVPLGNPQNDLHIDGVAGAAIIQLTNNSTGRTISKGLQLALSSTGNGSLYLLANKDLTFGTNSAACITIKNDGKLGFGTISPVSALHLDIGTANTGGFRVTNNATSGVTSTDGATFELTSASNLNITNYENSPISLFLGNGAAASEKVRIRETGKIHVTDDISKYTAGGGSIDFLHLSRASRNEVRIQFTNHDSGWTNATEGFFIGLSDTAGGDAEIRNETAGASINFYNQGVQVATIAPGGFGIATGSPTSYLHVDGSIAAAYYETAVDLVLSDTSPYFTIVVTADGKTVTLPAAATVPGRIYNIKAMIAGAGPTSVTVEADGAEIFDKIAGLLNLTLVGTTAGAAVQNEAVTVQSNGVGWTVISRTVDCHPGL